jgi:hypothetical protein
MAKKSLPTSDAITTDALPTAAIITDPASSIELTPSSIEHPASSIEPLASSIPAGRKLTLAQARAHHAAKHLSEA